MDWLGGGTEGDGLQLVRSIVGCGGGGEFGADECFGFGYGESGGSGLVGGDVLRLGDDVLLNDSQGLWDQERAARRRHCQR